jgi:hypothetical protein
MLSFKSFRRMMLYLFVFTLLIVGTGTIGIGSGNSTAQDWLRENRIVVLNSEVVVEGTIFSILPASKRMVLKSGNPEKTLVLGLLDGVEVSDGKAKLPIDTLQRGNDVLVVLIKTGYARAIYKK